MNQERFDQWCATLVSGEIPQATGKLLQEREDGRLAMCCLGVGEKIIGHGIIEDEGSLYFKGEMEDVDTLPTLEFHEWLGLIDLEERQRLQDEDGTTSGDIAIDWPFDVEVWEQGPGSSKVRAESPGSKISTCAGLNDAGLTFAQIVDVMRYFGIREGVTT